MITILLAIIIIGLLGVLFGVILVIASKKFAVTPNPLVEKINETLPGANCGACGYPGCAGYAEALAKDNTVPVTLCAPGGNACAEKLAEILGVVAVKQERKIARLACRGEKDYIRWKYDYKGIQDCEMAHKLMSGPKTCEQGCLMMGNCYRACQFDAIHFTENSLPRVIDKNCVGCGACVKACPRNLFSLLPESNHIFVACNNNDKGKAAKLKCDVACIACGLCAKNCPVQAITMTNNIPVIDYSKCIDCGICNRVCPVKPEKAITDLISPRPKVLITDNCKGCTLCAKKCPVQAISGKVKELHIIDQDKCVRCQVCYNVCRFDAITLIDEEKEI